MKELFYKIIYNKRINFLLRNVNRLVAKLFGFKFRLSPSGTVRLKLVQGRLAFRTNQTSYITYYIFWEGYKNFEYTPIFEKIVTQIDSFFDIGANIGYYSLIAAKVNPNIQIKAFEPSNGAYYFLEKNIALNGLKDNIQPEKIALLNHGGDVEFHEVNNTKYKYLKYNLSGEANISGVGEKPAFIKYTVACSTLDDYVNRNNISQLDLIKIDTEGCEDLILIESNETIRKFQPIIICETLFNKIEGQLEHIMKGHGYHFFNHIGEKLVETKTLLREKDNGVRNCFFVPHSKLYLIKDFL